MSLPISVVVPHMKSRRWFFNRYVLPSICANDPETIIVEEEDGGACVKRNAGAAKAKDLFLIFVDDDTVLAQDCLRKMLTALETEPKIGFAYSDYTVFMWPGISHPMGQNYTLNSRPFSAKALREFNYIDTTSLMRRHLFPGFDPMLDRFQDWDLWLTMTGKGVQGSFIPESLFMKFNVDEGISAKVPMEKPESIIRKKHNLP